MIPDAKRLLEDSVWNDVRFRLDEMARFIHRVEDAETRLAFVNLVNAVKQFEDMRTLDP